MNASSGIKAYNKISVESDSLGADPHKLISMLYQGAVLAIASAKTAMLRKDVPAKGAAISKAIMIIDEGLKASLDKKAGGELAENLAALYDYMGTRLLQANLRNDAGALDEVRKLLCDLGSAWDSIRPKALAADNGTVVPQLVEAAEPVREPAVAPVVQLQKAAAQARPAAAPQMNPAAPMRSANHGKLAAYGRV